MASTNITPDETISLSNDSMSLVSDQKSKRFMSNEVHDLIESERRIFKLTLTGLIYTL